MNLAESIHSIARNAHRTLRGESVVLRDAAGDISAEISDAIVTLLPPAVRHDDGPAEHEGTLRLQADHYAAALLARTATVRGQDWHVLTVGDVYAGTFRIELSRLDQTHPNLFDINQTQASWSGIHDA